MADLPTSPTPTPTPSLPPSAAASPSTRQLLEELDALMQRMLALPVEQGEDETSTKADTPSPVAAPHHVGLTPAAPAPVAAAPSAGGKQASFVVGRETPAAKQAAVDKKPALSQGEFSQPEAAPTYLPLGAEPLLPILLNRPKTGSAKPVSQVLPSAGLLEKTAKPEPLPAPRPIWVKTPPSPPAPTAPPRHGPLTRLLLGINRVFDIGTAVLGGAGRWLRGEQGRAILGWSGVAMVIAALIWAALRFLG